MRPLCGMGFPMTHRRNGCGSKGDGGTLTKGSGWLERNQAVDQIMAGSVVPDQEALKQAEGPNRPNFCMDMLLLKFVQGLPLVGVLGGVGIRCTTAAYCAMSR